MGERGAIVLSFHGRFVAALLACVFWAGNTLATEVVVVCPKSFQSAMKEWAQYREEQGHHLHWVSPGRDALATQKVIHSAIRRFHAEAVLLVGDVPRASARDRNAVPTDYIDAKVNLPWSKDKSIATDNGFADTDGDQIPDVALGRWPVDSAADIQAITHKVIHYETNHDFSDWRRRVSFVACPGDFGGVIDTALERAARKLTTAGIPPSFHTTATYGQWRSPYCPDPRRFLDCTLERLNEGSLFWVYIGHGQCEEVDEVSLPDRSKYPILRSEDVGSLTCENGHPIAVFLACHTGRFDDKVDSLGEKMFRSPGGPVAVYASTRVTMPYAMTVMSTELMRGYFDEHVGTLGELILHAKRQMALADRSNPADSATDSLAKILNPKSPDLLAERMEHLAMYHLLGDPLTRLAQPKTIELELVKPTEESATWTIRGQCPVEGKCRLEWIPPRDQLAFTPPVRRDFGGHDEAFQEFDDTYNRANDPVLFAHEENLAKGPFEIAVQVPSAAARASYIRAYVEGTDDYAAGFVESSQSSSTKN